MDAIVAALLEHLGAPGLIIAIFVWLNAKQDRALQRKDRELQEERNGRIEDAKETLRVVMAVQDKTSENISRLGQILEEARRQRGAA